MLWRFVQFCVWDDEGLAAGMGKGCVWGRKICQRWGAGSRGLSPAKSCAAVATCSVQYQAISGRACQLRAGAGFNCCMRDSLGRQ